MIPVNGLWTNDVRCFDQNKINEETKERKKKRVRFVRDHRNCRSSEMMCLRTCKLCLIRLLSSLICDSQMYMDERLRTLARFASLAIWSPFCAPLTFNLIPWDSFLVVCKRAQETVHYTTGEKCALNRLLSIANKTRIDCFPSRTKNQNEIHPFNSNDDLTDFFIFFCCCCFWTQFASSFTASQFSTFNKKRPLSVNARSFE